MRIGDYTTSERVRAVLGVDDNEFSDTALDAMMLGDQIESAMAEWLSDPDGLSAGDLRDLKLYATYQAAHFAASAAPAFLQSMSNEHDTVKRVALDLPKLAGEMLRLAGMYRRRLQLRLGTATTASVPRFVSSVAPDYDPVTNE